MHPPLCPQNETDHDSAEVELRALRTVLSEPDRRVQKRYDAPKWAAVGVVVVATILVFLLIGAVRLVLAVTG